jgi:hypothetical protein
LRPVCLAKVERMALQVRKSHDRKQLRLEADGSGECGEDGVGGQGVPYGGRPPHSSLFFQAVLCLAYIRPDFTSSQKQKKRKNNRQSMGIS